MIAVPNTSFVREADAYTIQNEPIASIDLMERASEAIVRQLVLRLQPTQEVVVFAGMGNNGGDGLAIARLLAKRGYDVRVYVVQTSKEGSADFHVNHNRLSEQTAVEVHQIPEAHELPESLPANCIVVDALFGSGLNKPIGGVAAQVVDFINRQQVVVVAVDIPSGLFADRATDLLHTAVVHADYTFTFEWPKQAFFFAENEHIVGEWQVVSIGLHPDMHRMEGQKFFLTESADISTRLRSRPRFAHKGNFGHALLMAGSAGKSGAAVLAASACLRSGVGLLHVHVPQHVVLPLQCALPEAMLSIDVNSHHLASLPDLSAYNAIGIGPGIGQEEETAKLLKLLIQEWKHPAVLDADALNILASHPTWLAFLPLNTILTPHVREFERLTGKAVNGFERLEKQREFSQRFGLVVVLKGAYSSISLPDGRVFFNPTGNPGMATAGSGDVLTGIILGLLAQGYSAADAAMTGVFLHGLAGDLAIGHQSHESLLAGDIVALLGKAFLKVRNDAAAY